MGELHSLSKSLVVLFSYHHHNTEKIAKVFAEVLQGQIKSALDTDPAEIDQYDLIGFGSGIYGESFHKAMLDLADKLPKVSGKNAFLFSTDGAPRGLLNDDHPMAIEQVRKNHRKIKEKLLSKGFMIVGEFNCGGWNTNSVLKLFGGLNKGRPNAEDLKKAEIFAQNLKQKFQSH